MPLSLVLLRLYGEGAMSESVICEGCGLEFTGAVTICPRCGWDQTTALAKPPRLSLGGRLRAGGWRLVVYGLILVLPVVGFYRLRTTGLGPDLPTTLRWMIFGDGGRAEELETIHRMYEIGSAASRYSVREMEEPPFDGDWETVLAPAATARVRGWIPMVFLGADTRLAPSSVRELYEVRASDGWGRPYRVRSRRLPRGDGWRADPEVEVDLSEGLQATFFSIDVPDFEYGEWLRLQIESAGRDGAFDTADDLRMVSYFRVGHVFRLIVDPDENRRQVERAYIIGRHYFRIEGSDYDLIDARLLAEYRLTSIH